MIYENIQWTGLTGDLILKNIFADMFSYNDDYAYKIYKNGTHSYEKIEMEPDTLDCPIDTVHFDGMYEDDTLGTQYHYQWNFGNGISSNEVHPQIFYSDPGVYTATLIVTNSSGESDTLTQQFVVLSCDSSNSRNVTHLRTINETENDNSFKIFPNPTTGMFTLQFSDYSDSEIFVYSILGNCVLKKQVLASKTKNISIDLSGHPKGIYMVKVIDSRGFIHIGKLILN